MPLAPGTKLGPYEILSPLGAGGMGEVYRARDTRLDRDVAVKILAREMSADPARKQRFQREAKTISALNHPNICVLYDIGSQDGMDYLVMECVEGETLAARLRSGRLAPEQISNYALQILDGLEKAHRQGILHRDLKPSNVMLTSDGRVKLLDFGLAKQFERPTGAASPHALQTVDFETAYGAPAGTFAYMSPEQALGKQLDARSDLFSFGTLLYEMATGTRPFAGDTPIELCDAILHRQPAQPRQLNPSIDAGLQGIILKCLEKEADLRYQTASEIATDFRRLKRSSNSADGAVPDQQNSSGNRASAKAMQLALRAAGVGIALLLIGGIAEWMRHSGRTPASGSTSEIHSLAVLPLKNLSSDATQEYFADGTTLDLITTLTKISNLKVISWTSVRGYKNTTKNLQEIGKELNADAVIDGSVEQSGDHVRITIGLIDARNDRNIWGQSYNRELRDILRLQEEVAGTVASEIRVALTPQDRARLSGTRPVDPEAYLLYMQGRSSMQRWTTPNLGAARGSFQQAIQKDPNYAAAYAGLAETYLTGADLDPKISVPLARTAATKALALDETISDAHVATAQLLYQDGWDWKEAEREFKRAIELNPGDTLAHHFYSHLLLTLGRKEESLQESELYVRLDPLSPVAYDHIGFQYLAMGQYEKSIEAYRKTQLLDPTWESSHESLGDAYRFQGMSKEAVQEYERWRVAEKTDTKIVERLREAFEKAGWAGYWSRSLQERLKESSSGYVSSYSVAILYARLGNKEEAFRYLGKAYADHDRGLTAIKFDQDLNAFLQGDPRYTELIKKMGLPE